MPWASTFYPLRGSSDPSILEKTKSRCQAVLSKRGTFRERHPRRTGYTGHLELISGIHENTWLSLNVPYGWTRRSVGGKLHYDRSGLRTLRIQIGRQIHENTHMTLGFSTASIEFGTPVSERFPAAKERFGALGPEQSALDWAVGYQDEVRTWRWGIQGALRLPRELEHSLTQAELYFLFRPGSHDLYIGPGCQFTRAISGEQILELKILERLELTEHWSFEFPVSQVLNVDSDSTTGLTGSIRWRGEYCLGSHPGQCLCRRGPVPRSTKSFRMGSNR